MAVKPDNAVGTAPTPLANPGAQNAGRRAALLEAAARVLDGNRYIQGPEVAAFETEFAAYVGVPHAVGVANGTEALALALRALGVEPGDEVLTIANAGAPIPAAIRMAGAVPRYVDTEPHHHTLDPGAIDAAIGPRTRAILVVHLYGHPAAVDAIVRIGAARGIPVVEDCAQAHGARWRGQRAGSFGAASCFSFYPTKNLGAVGDGGLVATPDAAVAAKLRLLREYGWDAERRSVAAGWNSRLDEMQAAMLRIKLRDLDADNARRRAIAARYRAALGSSVRVLDVHPEAEPVYHLFVVETDRREALLAHLKAQGVLGGIHYPFPVHQMEPWRPAAPVSLPCTERACQRVVSLPMYPELGNAEIDRVIAAVRSFHP